MSRTEQYLDLWIQEVEASLNSLQITYPDTYGQALVRWRMYTDARQKEDLDRKRQAQKTNP